MQVVLAAVFGGLLFVNVRRSLQREVDEPLARHAADLAAVLVPAEEGKFDVELSAEQVAYFTAEGESAAHYGIWTADGEVVDLSDPALAIPLPRTAGSRDRGPLREVSIRGPGQAWVLVGRNVEHERGQLRRLAASAIGIGVAALSVMLAGGWFITRRALAPIERITRAAAAVSAANLSQRIDVGQMETELALVAATINDAFDRLEQAFEQQTRFTADASHELRTPLSIVLSQVDLALSRERSAAEYRDVLATVRRAAQRMKRVIEGLLALARADAGRVQFHYEQFDLSGVVQETCHLIRPIAAQHQVAVCQDLQPVRVTADRDRLAEAVANLLSNAVHYNHSGGRVDVTLSRQGSAAVLRIADTGPGIPDDELPHIFERFYRVDKARSHAVEGSGLGLAITKWIIDAHGGSISCTNGENGGAVFVVTLASIP
jgi:heavy metal sensor kinase